MSFITTWPPRLDVMETKGDRILWLEATAPAWGLSSTGEVNFISDSVQDRQEEWIKRVKELVADDRKKHVSERIDSVVWLIERHDEPSAAMWQALDGLSPEHLQMLCGFDEGYDIEPLDTLRHPWINLKTFSLDNYNRDSIVMSQKLFSQITCLVCKYVTGTRIPPHATQLREWHIYKGSALDMFCQSVGGVQNPGLAGQLNILEIYERGSVMAGYIPEEFWERLQECTNLRRLSYTNRIGYGLEVGLAEYIPPAVEILTLGTNRCLPFLRELDNWIVQASNPAWLPHLRSFSIITNPESAVDDFKLQEHTRTYTSPLDHQVVRRVQTEAERVDPPVGYTPEIFDQEFEVKKHRLYEVLKAVKPGLHFPA